MYLHADIADLCLCFSYFTLLFSLYYSLLNCSLIDNSFWFKFSDIAGQHLSVESINIIYITSNHIAVFRKNMCLRNIYTFNKDDKM